MFCCKKMEGDFKKAKVEEVFAVAKKEKDEKEAANCRKLYF